MHKHDPPFGTKRKYFVNFASTAASAVKFETTGALGHIR